MKYLVDGGKLLWVFASKPEDAARLAALDLHLPMPSKKNENAVLVVYEPRSGYRFPFQLVDPQRVETSDERQEGTSRV